MIRATRTLALVCAAGLAAAASPAVPARAALAREAVQLRIVGGTQSAEGSYPWMARIRMPAGTQGYAICGATLISPDILLTAQHCVDDATRLEAFVGKVDWKSAEPAGLKRESSQFRQGTGPLRGDWAVARLTTPLDLPAYPLLPASAAHDAGPTFRALGYGKTAQKAPKSEQYLREVDLPAVPDSRCGAAPRYEVCAGDWERGGVDTCQADSGGPLLKQVPGGWLQVGVTSWGHGCGRPQSPGHYTRVSAVVRDIQAAITALGGQPARTAA
ncbi:MAG TPA: serine protease [Pilimelia sp.]|nr:serine protease [Pilimelia sp.]